ncbi:hypothetical protein DSL72_002028 [Monilinia vaccinii-corymbosi]|uniref:DUF202 domain-containing protein n=1 Tax=Monilinia vaccinii-corymbosi TaxID=61207 RepID=A0A8A3PBG7_9HELO|nr:hypothetical protein DSL72_002028 [Monilinia vaccinii-corymbosi]
MSSHGLGRFVGMFEVFLHLSISPVSSIFATSVLTMSSLLNVLEPHPEDRLHLRLHRARSVILTAQELVEIRAAQRTFEGAYIRTALGQFSFALVVLKIFTAEFYSIGALFATYGAGVLMVSMYRRYEGNRQFFSEIDGDGMGRKKFRTSGNAVVVLTTLSLADYMRGTTNGTYMIFLTAQGPFLGSGQEMVDIKAADKMTEKEGGGHRRAIKIRHCDGS